MPVNAWTSQPLATKPDIRSGFDYYIGGGKSSVS